MLPRRQTLAAASSPALWSLGSWEQLCSGQMSIPQLLGEIRLDPPATPREKSHDHSRNQRGIAFTTAALTLVFQFRFPRHSCVRVWVLAYPLRLLLNSQNSLEECMLPTVFSFNLNHSSQLIHPHPFPGSVEAHTCGPSRLPTASGCPPNLPEFPV